MRRTAAAVLVGAVVGLVPAAGTAAAQEPPGLIVSDGAPLAPGTVLRAQMACEEPTTTPAVSPALRGGPWERDPDGRQPWAVFSTLTVAEDADSGTYPVTATCGAQSLTTEVTVDAPTSPALWIGVAVAVVVGGGGVLAVLARSRRSRSS